MNLEEEKIYKIACIIYTFIEDLIWVIPKRNKQKQLAHDFIEAISIDQRKRDKIRKLVYDLIDEK